MGTIGVDLSALLNLAEPIIYSLHTLPSSRVTKVPKHLEF